MISKKSGTNLQSEIYLILISGEYELFGMHDTETNEILAELLWLNAVIATELIQITENSSAILRKSPPPESCFVEHNELRKTALAIAEKYRPGTMLGQHILKHQ
jgi:hypothetical protein